MILLCGIPSETPLALVRRRLDAMDRSYVVLNQRAFARCAIAFEIRRGEPAGTLRIGSAEYKLEDFSAVYARLMDDRSLPELKSEPPDSPARRQCRGFHEALTRWIETSEALVVNRCAAMATNSSKPYQAQLIQRHGFRTPETLVTTNPDAVRAFRAQHGRLIYKSASAARSIVQEFTDADAERLDRIRWCPTQFQAFVEGTNVRVHTIGRRVYATAIRTEATDYRYAGRQSGEPAHLREVLLRDETAQQCIDLAASLGLAFAGIDLKVTPDEEVYCFEVNPSPAYSYYESNSGQTISQGLAEVLADAAALRSGAPREPVMA